MPKNWAANRVAYDAWHARNPMAAASFDALGLPGYLHNAIRRYALHQGVPQAEDEYWLRRATDAQLLAIPFVGRRGVALLRQALAGAAPHWSQVG